MKNVRRLLQASYDGKIRPMQVFSDLAVEFLDDLAKILRTKGSRYPDVASVAFWCRKSNVLRMKGENTNNSLGRGLIFHITPSNVPVNFAFSFFFGLLSGNANIIRIPSKDYEQIDVILSAVNELFKQEKYAQIGENTAFIKYGHEKEITDEISAACDGRIIWGGDAAINTIRQSPLKAKSVEVVFADRYSLGVIDSESVAAASDQEMERLATGFYNDTYLMDQNACSTPHLILWRGNADSAVKKFWSAVLKVAAKYDLEPIKAVDKYTDLMLACMDQELDIKSVNRYGNLLYVAEIEKMPSKIEKLRGRFGMFFEFHGGMDSITDLIDEKVQSVMYYGVSREDIAGWVMDNHLMGVDRIVPFGKSLDMNINWDGYDIIRQLSRTIIFE